MDLDAKIDALYALPLGEFTAARNALAKTLKGDPAATTVKALAKPSVLAWAINQLYWHDRALFDRVMTAGQALRAGQIARLEGRGGHGDTTASEHRSALAAASAAANRRADAAGLNAPTDSLGRMLETLSTAAGLPAHPGRFVEAVQPAGFEALLGLAPATASRLSEATSAPKVSSSSAPPHKGARSAKGTARASQALELQRQQAAAAAAMAAAQSEAERARLALGEAEKAEARTQTHVDEARARLGVAEAGLSIARKATADARRQLEKAERLVESISGKR